MKTYDIVIISARLGSGHTSVANTLKRTLMSQDHTLRIHCVDLYEMIMPYSCNFMYKMYDRLVMFTPFLYNIYYDMKNRFSFVKSLDTASRKQYKRFEKYIDSYRPKMIVSTFPVATGWAVKYKKTHKNVKVMTCMTDLVDSEEWIYKDCDQYFVGLTHIKQRLINKGIDEHKILVTGIPICNKFSLPQTKNQVRQKLQYAEDDFVIIMIGGILGLLPNKRSFYKWVLSLAHVKLIVLTGRNKRLYKRLKHFESPSVKVIEYAPNVVELMKSADLFIGKAGGITLFELIRSRVPIIIHHPILRQEIINCTFIETSQLGVVAHSMKALKASVEQLVASNELKQQMIQAQNVINMELCPSLLESSILEVLYNKKKND